MIAPALANGHLSAVPKASKAAKRRTSRPKPQSVPRALARLRRLSLSFEGAHEVEAWGAPTFRVSNKLFAMFAADGNHHGNGRRAVWIKAKPENQDLLIRTDPERYFKPPYVGPSGWIGAWLDGDVPWNDVKELLVDGYELVLATLPKRLHPGDKKPRRSGAK
jgi:predicted DNA-binding protein (MmcQ/YjbR family)